MMQVILACTCVRACQILDEILCKEAAYGKEDIFMSHVTVFTE
jgi:hypothetical protein